ncbi:hypothetical protein SLS55_006804 [Diplodia seriata]|uniref:LysM domain-containing protein n=1 Tax=Diplodia seriata TaxID=420778 RepID=A0ABR3CBI1_9PEZI
MARFMLTIPQLAQTARACGWVGQDTMCDWKQLTATGYRYCVRTPDYEDPTPPSTSTTTTAPAAPTATSPVLPGQPANCVKWYTVKGMSRRRKGRAAANATAEGDSCATVENAMFITHAQFLEWNPEVSDDCGTGFWLGYGYCVGTSDDSPTRSSSVASSTTTTTATPAPSPTQDNNAPSACNSWSQAQEGDYCALFADRNGVTPEQLYEWNSVLGSDGSSCNTMFWATYWYCVGVSASP